MSYKLYRIKTISTIRDQIKPLILDVNDYSVDEFLDAYERWMKESPNQVYVLAAVDSDQIIGLLMAHCNDEWSQIDQAWVSPGAMDGISELMFLRLIHWSTESRGVDKIRAETIRNSESIMRSWGFKPLYSVIQYDITPQNELAILDKARRAASAQESNNGQNIENRDQVESDTGTASSSESSGNGTDKRYRESDSGTGRGASSGEGSLWPASGESGDEPD